MSAPVPLEISLANEKFRLKAAPEDHPHLLEVSQLVNTRIVSLHQDGGALTIQRAALMAAFQFACELDEIGAHSGMSETEILEASCRIESMISQIDEKMK